jgi:tetratricopeptide (TPR) repeat protein
MKPNDPTLLLRGARVYSNYAYAHSSMGDLAGAIRWFQEGIVLLERREKVLGSSAIDEERRPLVEELCKVTSFLIDHGLTDAPRYYFSEFRGRARKGADELLAKDPGTSVHNLWRYDLAGRMDLSDGNVARDNGDFDQARALYTRAAERLGTATGAPGWFWVRLYLAHAHRGLGMVAHETGDEATVDREFAEALKIIRAQVAANPTHVDPRYVLAWTQALNGRRLASDPARGAEAEAAFAEALSLLEKFCNDFPEETRYVSARAVALLGRGEWQAASGRLDLAEKDLEAARADFSKVGAREHDDRYTPVRLGRAEVALGKLRIRQGRDGEARQLLDSAVGRLKRILEERPKNLDARRTLPEARDALGK